ncbi:MAG: aspartate aminotransferase family protein [Saprospiraceae bacterium]
MKLFDVYPVFDIEPVKGDGSYIYDKSGTKYLDFYGGHAVISIGHSHPHYVKKVSEQLSNLGFYSNSVENSLQVELAEKLGKLSGLEDYQLFLCNSGAEANENALKMASFATGKTKIIAFENAFHGRTSSAVNITQNSKIQAPINQTFEREWLPLNEIEPVKLALEKGDVAAVIIEGIQGIGGIYIPTKSFLEAVAELCQTHNLPLILDEIQSGTARSGKFFAFQYADIQPDIISIAKGFGNGFPIGGILLAPKYKATYGLLGTTFGGNHLACAAALATLEVIENENLIENANTIGDYLQAKLKQIPAIKAVRGKGLMIGIDFDFPVKALRTKLVKEHQLFTGSAGNPNTIRLLPPLNVTKAEADLFLEIFERGLNAQIQKESLIECL